MKLHGLPALSKSSPSNQPTIRSKHVSVLVLIIGAHHSPQQRRRNRSSNIPSVTRKLQWRRQSVRKTRWNWECLTVCKVMTQTTRQNGKWWSCYSGICVKQTANGNSKSRWVQKLRTTCSSNRNRLQFLKLSRSLRTWPEFEVNFSRRRFKQQVPALNGNTHPRQRRAQISRGQQLHNLLRSKEVHIKRSLIDQTLCNPLAPTPKTNI